MGIAGEAKITTSTAHTESCISTCKRANLVTAVAATAERFCTGQIPQRDCCCVCRRVWTMSSNELWAMCWAVNSFVDSTAHRGYCSSLRTQDTGHRTQGDNDVMDGVCHLLCHLQLLSKTVWNWNAKIDFLISRIFLNWTLLTWTFFYFILFFTWHLWKNGLMLTTMPWTMPDRQLSQAMEEKRAFMSQSQCWYVLQPKLFQPRLQSWSLSTLNCTQSIRFKYSALLFNLFECRVGN